jgi:polyisoprenoid-binding protein YceI
MKSFKLLLLLAVINNYAFTQNYFTKNGKVSFFSKTSAENIDAASNQALSVLNTATNELAFSVLVKSFQFKKALMQEHFNENYVESDKFPKSTFKGTISSTKKIDYTKDGTYPVTVSGDLTLHGVTKKATANGNITISGGKIAAKSEFTISLSDYNIVIPKLVEASISNTIKISVDGSYEKK